MIGAARKKAMKSSRDQSLGRRSDLREIDVSKASDVKAMIEQTVAKFGRLDLPSTTPVSSRC
jgi:hypothetical protein